MSVDPKVVIVFFIKNFLGTIYIFPIWFVSVFVFEQVWANTIETVSKTLVILLLDVAGCLFFALLLLGCYYWSWLIFSNFTYELLPNGLHIRRGVIIRRHKIIPYTDIENVELLVNPLVFRFLSLCTLQIKTRELLDTEGIFRKKQIEVIPGLTAELARSLRVELLKGSHIHTVKKTFFDPVSGRYR